MPRLAYSLLTVCVMCLSVGCGGPPSVSVKPPPPPAAKALLSDVAKSGELGSAAMTIRESLTELKKTDAAKADGLLKELDELEAMSDPAAIQAKATAMSEKL